MNRFIDSLLLAFKGDTDEKLFINKADSNEKLNKMYDDFDKKAGIEDLSLKNELFSVVFAHAVEYERQGFEQGFKLGMKTAIAALSEPDTTK